MLPVRLFEMQSILLRDSKSLSRVQTSEDLLGVQENPEKSTEHFVLRLMGHESAFFTVQVAVGKG